MKHKSYHSLYDRWYRVDSFIYVIIVYVQILERS